MLGCIKLEERHDAFNIKSFLEAKFIEWNIQHYVNVINVADNASNVLSAVHLSEWSSLPWYEYY